MYRAGNNDVILEADNGDFYRQDIANSNHAFFTGNTERLHIDSSGRLGVGVNSFHDSSTRLQLQSPGSDHTGIVITAAATSTLSYIYFGDTADKDIGRLVYENSSDSMQFWTNNAERLRIDSSGRVMVGTTAASTLTSSDDLTISTSGSTGITLFSATGNAGNIAFGDGTSGDDRQRGLLQYHHSDNTMRFFTNAARRMTITSEGALLLSTAGIRRNTKGSSQYQAFLIEGITNDTTRMSMIRSSNDDNGPEIQIIKTRGTSVGSVTKPNQNDYLGAFVFLAGDDSDLFTRGAEIGVQATGTPANDRCPSDIIFSTTPLLGEA
jgi:hypothetical protein